MSYMVKKEAYLRSDIQSGLTALVHARPEWIEVLEAVAILFNVEVEAPRSPPGAPMASQLQSIPRRRTFRRVA